MIVRNLDRRRARAFLSSLAVGFAVAILVVGWYRIDAVNQLADIQFNNLQREDVTVIFREPKAGRRGVRIGSSSRSVAR